MPGVSRVERFLTGLLCVCWNFVRLGGAPRLSAAPGLFFLLSGLRINPATHVDSGICLQHVTRAVRCQVENDIVGEAVQHSGCPAVTRHLIATDRKSTR